MVTKCSITGSRVVVVLEMEGEESGRGEEGINTLGFSVCYIENLSYIRVHYNSKVHTRAGIVQANGRCILNSVAS